MRVIKFLLGLPIVIVFCVSFGAMFGVISIYAMIKEYIFDYGVRGDFDRRYFVWERKFWNLF